MNEAAHTHLIETESARKEAVWCRACSSHVVSQDGFAVRACSKAPVKSLLFGFYGHDLSSILRILYRVAERFHESFAEGGWNFHVIPVVPGH